MSRTESHIPVRSWADSVKSDLQEFVDYVQTKDIRQPYKSVILEEVTNFQRERGRS